MRKVGTEGLAMNCWHETQELARDDDGILRVRTAQRDHEDAVAAKRRRASGGANDRSLAPHDLKRQIREAEAALIRGYP